MEFRGRRLIEIAKLDRIVELAIELATALSRVSLRKSCALRTSLRRREHQTHCDDEAKQSQDAPSCYRRIRAHDERVSVLNTNQRSHALN